MNIKWQVSPKVLSSKIDDEVILMSFEADSYFGLDPVASSIWQLIDKQPSTIDELVQLLLEEYEIDEHSCRNDVQKFIDEMSEKKLIQQAE
jgi:hypothetical protein